MQVLSAFTDYGVSAVVRRLRGRRGAPPARHAARWLAITGPLTILGLFGYLGYFASTGAKSTDPVVLGRPLPWLVLQLLALGVVAATVTTVKPGRTPRSTPRGRARCRW